MYIRIYLFIDLGKDLTVTEQGVLLVTDLDVGAAKRRDQHTVAGPDTGSTVDTLAVDESWTDGENVGFVQLLNILLGDVDTRSGFCLGLDTLDEHAVKERDNGLDGLETGGHLYANS